FSQLQMLKYFTCTTGSFPTASKYDFKISRQGNCFKLLNNGFIIRQRLYFWQLKRFFANTVCSEAIVRPDNTCITPKTNEAVSTVICNRFVIVKCDIFGYNRLK